jgi:hypothetical protein
MAVASVRLALQYDGQSGSIRYDVLILLLFIEASVALVMAGISCYRVLVVDFLDRRERGRRLSDALRMHDFWVRAQSPGEDSSAKSANQQPEYLQQDVHHNPSGSGKKATNDVTGVG